MDVIPVKPYILIKPIPIDEKTPSGLIIPNQKPKIEVYEVIDSYDESPYEIRDIVLPLPYKGLKIEVAGIVMYLIRDDEIIAKISM